jgi:hypothetical protein
MHFSLDQSCLILALFLHEQTALSLICSYVLEYQSAATVSHTQHYQLTTLLFQASLPFFLLVIALRAHRFPNVNKNKCEFHANSHSEFHYRFSIFYLDLNNFEPRPKSEFKSTSRVTPPKLLSRE